MAAWTDCNWEAQRASIERHIAEGESIYRLAWRYQVAVPTMQRALKQLGLETFHQRFQRLAAKKSGS